MTLEEALSDKGEFSLVYRPRNYDYCSARLYYGDGYGVVTYQLFKYQHTEVMYERVDITQVQALALFADAVAWLDDKWGRRITYEELCDWKPLELDTGGG